ncbi:MAG TPA: DMT family transporter [Gemmatimonadales bacterium]|nr:DMT family transporter [Gemmatimonadales bacterium]
MAVITATSPKPTRPVGFTGTDALLALTILFWGTNFIVAKAALGVMSPLAFNMVRFTLSSATIAAIAWAMGSARPTGRQIVQLAALGVLANTIYQLGFIEGLARTRAGNAALIMAGVPVQTAIVSHLRGTERLGIRDVLGLALSTAGIAAIVFGSGRSVGFGATVTGDLLVFFATLCWTAFTVLSKPLADQLGPVTSTAWTMCLGSIPMLLIAIPSALAQDWSRVGPAAWVGTVYSGVCSLSLAYLFWYRGVQRLGPARTSFYSNFTPAVAMLAAWAFLHENPNLWQLSGAAGIFGGIWLTKT